MVDAVILKQLNRIGWATFQLKHDQVAVKDFLAETHLALAAIEEYSKITPDNHKGESSCA